VPHGIFMLHEHNILYHILSKGVMGQPEDVRKLTVLDMQRRIERLRARIQDLKEFDPDAVTVDGFRKEVPELTALSDSIQRTLENLFGENTAAFHRFSAASRVRLKPSWGDEPWLEPNTLQHDRQVMRENIARSVALLERAIKTLEQDIVEAEEISEGSLEGQLIANKKHSELSTRKVFVVHGHDDAALQAVARFLEKLKLEATVLREQPDQGRTIIEKFEDYASEVGFAVVLLTPDDLTGAAATPLQTSRARQNVIFELGYFVGKLGRGRACLLRKGEVEIPSDLYGVIYSEMDSGEGPKVLPELLLIESAERFEPSRHRWRRSSVVTHSLPCIGVSLVIFEPMVWTGFSCLLDDCALKEERWTDCESRQTDQVCVFENCVGRRTNRCRRGYEPESSSSSRFFQLTPRLK
jgi:predicted nucleotide-binding protein